MKQKFSFPPLKQYLYLLIVTIIVAAVVGAMVALFLWLLNWAIHFRFANPWLLYLLPLAGVGIYFTYANWGKNSDKGNNLIMDEIYMPGGGIPKRMAPLVLAATVVTHLFGGSAGREGTAVQIGGSIAQWLGGLFKLDNNKIRTLLITGIAAGFGAVFGTPLAGAIFAMEVLTLSKVKYNALIPCLLAGFIGDATVNALPIHHTPYHITDAIAGAHLLSVYIPTNVWLILKIIIAAGAFGLCSWLFAFLVHGVKNAFNKFISIKWLIPVLGGIIIIALAFINGKPDYLSLGVDAESAGAITIPSAFTAGGADTWSWLWKTIYTVITLGTGFKGGEVTPLFYIGATLGNTLSTLLHAPVGLFAALGFIAVFAGATNTPLASTIMGAELFGSEYILLFALACFVAYLCSGHAGIYSAQRFHDDEFFGDDLQPHVQQKGYITRKLKKYS